RAAGPRIGKAVQQVIPAAKRGDWVASGDNVVVGGIELLPSEFELELTAADESSAITFLAGGGFVLLDTATTPELEAEGLARDVIRAVQDTRKAAGFDVSDRIALSLFFEAETEAASVSAFTGLIGDETLSRTVTIDAGVGAELSGAPGAYRSVVAAGKFANAGGITIDVVRLGESEGAVVDV